MPILFQMFCLCFVFLFIWLSVLGFKASKVRWTKVTGVPRTTSSVVYFSSGKKIKIWVVGQKSRGEYAWKAADRNCPCKVVVFKNKVKCLPTVTVLLLASIPPECLADSGGRRRGSAVPPPPSTSLYPHKEAKHTFLRWPTLLCVIEAAGINGSLVSGRWLGVSASLRKGWQKSWFARGQLASYSLSRRPQSTTTPIRGEGFGYSAEEVFFAKRFKQPERCQETYWKVTAVPDILQGTRETRMQDTGREEGLERHECRIRTERL